MKHLLWIGDAGVPSGFAKATHCILESLDYRVAGDLDCTVLGINFRGDPHPYPYPIYAAMPGGDGFGVGRLVWMCDRFKPDVIVIQQDGWNIQSYISQLKRFPEHAGIPVVAIVAVDGKNFTGSWLNGVAKTIFWTKFALAEARAGGYKGSAEVIPLGVDLTTFYPGDRMEARARRKVETLGDSFVVGCVNRNQPRKRWDLLVKFFCEWAKDRNIRDAWLYLHTAPTGDLGPDVLRLMNYYGMLDHLALAQPGMYEFVPEDEMRDVHCCFDVQATTTQGEGFGLGTFEGAACGVAQIATDCAAIGELMRGAARLVKCTQTGMNHTVPHLNVIGAVAEQEDFTLALDEMYSNRGSARDIVAAAGLARVREPRFRWSNVAASYAQAIKAVIEDPEAVWHDLGRPEEVEAE